MPADTTLHTLGGAPCSSVAMLSGALCTNWLHNFHLVGLRVEQKVAVWVPGRVVPKGRPRAYGSRLVTPAATREYEAVVEDACRRLGVDVPTGDDVVIGVHLVVVEARTGKDTAKKRASRWVKVRNRGDLDNQIKSVVDGAQNSGVVENDSHVVAIEGWRVMASAESPKNAGALLRLVWARPVV